MTAEWLTILNIEGYPSGSQTDSRREENSRLVHHRTASAAHTVSTRRLDQNTNRRSRDAQVVNRHIGVHRNEDLIDEVKKVISRGSTRNGRSARAIRFLKIRQQSMAQAACSKVQRSNKDLSTTSWCRVQCNATNNVACNLQLQCNQPTTSPATCNAMQPRRAKASCATHLQA